MPFGVGRTLTKKATLLISLLLLSGCVTLTDFEASQEQRGHVVGEVRNGQGIGQTFIARGGRLNGIQLWLSPPTEAEPGQALRLSLFESPVSARLLARQEIPYKDLAKQYPVTFTFPPQARQPGQSYYLLLEADGGPVKVYGRDEDAYPSGELLVNGSPAQGDLSFRLTYDYNLDFLIGDIGYIISNIWLALPFLLLFWLPGRLLLQLLAPWLAQGKPAAADRPPASPGDQVTFSGGNALDWGEHTALSIGLSLSIVPVLMLWTTQLGLRWSKAGILIALGLLVLVYLVSLREALFATKQSLTIGAQRLLRMTLRSNAAPRNASPPPGLPQIQQNEFGGGAGGGRRGLAAFLLPIRLDMVALGLALIFLASLAVRLIMVRDMTAPAWVDSVHHALLTRLILEKGGFPDTYQPYLEAPNALYHTGFHSLAAAFIWLTGMEISKALLLLGQLFNALAVFAVYLFTTRLVRDRLSGLVAALVTGLVTPMPAYYTSWGRYTQLSGLLILPVVFFVTMAVLEATPPARSARLRLLALGGLACAGLLLTHYRVAAFTGCLVLAALLTRGGFALRERRKGNQQNGPQVEIPAQNDIGYAQQTEKQSKQEYLGYAHPGSSFLTAFTRLSALALASVLLSLPWWLQTLPDLVASTLQKGASNTEVFSDFAWRYLNTALGVPAMLLAGLGLLWGLFRRRWFAWALLAWLALLFMLANLGAFGVPAGGYMNSTSVEIMLFIPISLLAGYLVSDWGRGISRRLKDPLRPYFLGLCALLALGTGWLGAQRLLPILNPVTMLFRQADRPAMAWIEANLPQDAVILVNPISWGYGLYAGSDGGFWITPLTGRRTLPPPVLFALGGSSETYRQTREACKRILELAGDPAGLHAYLQELDIRYIYLGARGGALSPRALQASPLFRVIYAQEGVWIFEAARK